MSILFAATYPERTAALVCAERLPAQRCGRRTTPGAEAEELPSARSSATASCGAATRPGHREAVPLGRCRRRGGRGVRGTMLRFGVEPGRARGAAPDEHGDRHPRRPTGGPGARPRPARRATTRSSRSRSAATSPSASRPRAWSRCPGDRPLARRSADVERSLDEIERVPRPSVGGGRLGVEPDRVLATVLFTDIVGSTAQAAELGDRALAGAARAAPRARPRGSSCAFADASSTRPATASSPPSTGRRARFGAPARSPRRCRELGIEVRAGLHTGECELVDGKVAGIAVSIGARVAARARPGEVLVSQTVKDLVAGSGIEFEDRGVRRAQRRPGRVEAVCRLQIPETRYAKSGDVDIAYQVTGEGPLDLVLVPGLHLERRARLGGAGLAASYRPCRFCRLIVFDKRGTGLSDRVTGDRRPGDAHGRCRAPSWMPSGRARRGVGYSEGSSLARCSRPRTPSGRPASSSTARSSRWDWMARGDAFRHGMSVRATRSRKSSAVGDRLTTATSCCANDAPSKLGDDSISALVLDEAATEREPCRAAALAADERRTSTLARFCPRFAYRL